MIMEAITTRRLPIKEAVASLNSDVHLTIAMEAVGLTPDTTIVAPVSPKERAKARTAPEKTPERAKGDNMFLKVVRELAPSDLDAISKVESIDWNLVSTVRTTYGKVRATCTMNVITGTFISGNAASRGMTPESKPRKPPMPALVVQVISVAKPNPDVGITKGSVTISSKKLLPGNLFLANT